MRLRISYLRTLIREGLLLEGQVDDIKKSYEGHQRRDEILKAVNDLVGIPPQDVKWAAKQVADGQPPGEVVKMVRDFSTKYKQKLKSRGKSADLQSYRTLGDLRGAIEETSRMSFGDDDERIRRESEVIYEDEDVLVVHPTSKASSCHLGRGTKWCVSATESENYFESYAGDNIFLDFVILKGAFARKAPGNYKKVAFAFHVDPRQGVNWSRHGSDESTPISPFLKRDPIEVYDSSDARVNLNEYERFLGISLFRKIYGLMKDHVNKNEMTGYLRRMSDVTAEEMEERLIEAEKTKSPPQLRTTNPGPGDNDVHTYDNGAIGLAARYFKDEKLYSLLSDDVKEVVKKYMTGVLYSDDAAVEEYYLNGIFHRDDGPARIDRSSHGVEFWRHGRLDRLDGPATIGRFYKSGEDDPNDGFPSFDSLDKSEWFVDGRRVRQFTEDQSYEDALKGIPAKPLRRIRQ